MYTLAVRSCVVYLLRYSTAKDSRGNVLVYDIVMKFK